MKTDLGAKVITVKYLGRIPPGTRAVVRGRATDLSYFHLYIPGREKNVTCRESDFVLEFDYVPEKKEHCRECERWVGASSYSPQFEVCSSCLEDMETEEMEAWIRADYNSRCTL
jgi:hypothetical protein